MSATVTPHIASRKCVELGGSVPILSNVTGTNPEGTIPFRPGPTGLGAATVGASGLAPCTTSPLPPGAQAGSAADGIDHSVDPNTSPPLPVELGHAVLPGQPLGSSCSHDSAFATPLFALATRPVAPAATPTSDVPADLVVISPELVAAVPQDELAGARVVVLDAGQDVISQLGSALRAHPGTAVVRLISHGEPGSLLVAGQRLNRDSLARRADAIASWRKYLAPAAEILLYGCAVAATPAWRSFVDAIAALTGAEVAASTTPTGSTAKGGDLRLNYETGPIKAITDRFAQAWDQAGLILAAPMFTSAANTEFTRTVAGTFTAAATGATKYAIAQATLFSANFTDLPSDWMLANSAQISGGALTLNPATATSTDGSLVLPKLGASSPGSFTASFDYTVANVSLGNASGTSFNYGAISSSSGSATGMIGTNGNGLVVSFLEATSGVPSSVEVRWNGNVIGKAPVTFGSGTKPVQIKLDGANRLTVNYDGSQLICMDLAGQVNAADRSNWQFALGAKNGTTNLSSHTIDNLAIVTNGTLPDGISLNPTTGVISGTPTAANSAGQQVFNLVASNADGATSQPFRLSLASGTPVFTSPATSPTLPGVPTTIAIAASGTAGSTTYSVSPQTLLSNTLGSAGNLPDGAFINGSASFNAGALDLTPTMANQTGSLQFLGQGALNPTAFSVSFNYKMGGGTAGTPVSGNGISFNYGPPGNNKRACASVSANPRLPLLVTTSRLLLSLVTPPRLNWVTPRHLVHSPIITTSSQ